MAVFRLTSNSAAIYYKKRKYKGLERIEYQVLNTKY